MGQEFNIIPGCPNLIERIEGGLFSYGNEMTRANNPLEIGLEKYCSFDDTIEYIGKDTLKKIAKEGVKRKLRGVIFGENPCPTCSLPWPVKVGKVEVGAITSAIFSPRLKANVGLSMIDRNYWHEDQDVNVYLPNNEIMSGKVVRPSF